MGKIIAVTVALGGAAFVMLMMFFQAAQLEIAHAAHQAASIGF